MKRSIKHNLHAKEEMVRYGYLKDQFLNVRKRGRRLIHFVVFNKKKGEAVKWEGKV